MPLTERSHYVPQLYLKHFAKDGLINTYRVLVSRKQVRDWKSSHIAAIGYQRHLYTRIIQSGPSDEIETWLNQEFENPAEAALERAVKDDRLTADDYTLLARFVAAQIVRTPAYFLRHQTRWAEEVEVQLGQTLSQLPAYLRGGLKPDEKADWVDEGMKSLLPLRVTKERDGKNISVKVHTSIGRTYWQFAMKVALNHTWKKLASHRWTILSSNEGLPWFTSDDPVLLLNFNNIQNFDFGGGWGRPGSEIILPISPTKILYTQIDHRVPQRGTKLSIEHNIILRSLLAEHAHRYIFAREIDDGVPFLRPRRVDSDAFEHDRRIWDKWHLEQSAVEQEFF